MGALGDRICLPGLSGIEIGMTISDISLALLKEPSSLFGQREVFVEVVALSPFLASIPPLSV